MRPPRSKKTQINVRLEKADFEAFKKLVDRANVLARNAGLPDDVTMASLVRMYVRKAIKEGVMKA